MKFAAYSVPKSFNDYDSSDVDEQYLDRLYEDLNDLLPHWIKLQLKDLQYRQICDNFDHTGYIGTMSEGKLRWQVSYSG